MKRSLYIIVTAPLEVVGVSAVYAYRGFMLGIDNVRTAWRDRASFSANKCEFGKAIE